MIDPIQRLCPRCGNRYPLTTEYWYPARKLDRDKTTWQSYCRNCWVGINFANKTRRREIRKAKKVIDDYFKPVVDTGF